MNIYGGHHDYSLYLFDLGATDPAVMEYLYHPRSRSGMFYDYGYNDDIQNKAETYSASVSSASEGNKTSSSNKRSSPPKHRHDGTSPLPLGMDWSSPPRVWDGRNSVWPHDFHSGWSYCVTVPSSTIIPKTRGSDPVVFYRVQVGIQSPEGITSVRGILRRFSDFLKLSSDLKREFPKKKLPQPPPRGILRSKSKDLMEQRRCSLEDWMAKFLTDIDISRSLPVAIFLELEAAARSAFYESSQNVSDANESASGGFPSDQIIFQSDGSLVAGTSFASDYGNDSANEASELGGTPRHGRGIRSELGMDNATNDPELINPMRASVKDELPGNNDVTTSNESLRGNEVKTFHYKKLLRTKDSIMDQLKDNTNTSQVLSDYGDDLEHISGSENFIMASHARRLSRETLETNIHSERFDLPEDAEASKTIDLLSISDLEFPLDLSIVLPTDEQHKINRTLKVMLQRLGTARTDVEDLIARLNQELAVREYLSTKVKDLEIELDTTKQSKEESLQQAILIERERVTQMQWDMEELRRNCMEMELKLKHDQEEKILLESTKASIIQENESLREELHDSRDRFENLLKHREESEFKSKSDVKILAKEIKSLRSSQSEMKQEISRLTNEKVEVERILQEERQRREHASAANAKLLHECEILRSRLEECSVNFLIEEENKLTVDISSVSEAMDILTTSDNRIGLLLAEAQLLAQVMENNVLSSSTDGHSKSGTRATDNKLWKMLTDVLIDNASLRKRINSIILYALSTPEKSEKDGEESVLSKFLER